MRDLNNYGLSNDFVKCLLASLYFYSTAIVVRFKIYRLVRITRILYKNKSCNGYSGNNIQSIAYKIYCINYISNLYMDARFTMH